LYVGNEARLDAATIFAGIKKSNGKKRSVDGDPFKGRGVKK